MSYEFLNWSKEGSLGWITIQREHALNALNSGLLTELEQAVTEFELDDEVQVVAVTGAGKAFIAGADIAEMQSLSVPQAEAFAERGGRLGALIERSSMPYIAAVNGFALGGGCEVAMACDFIYASTKAKFGQPEVKLGVIPGFGGTQRLARRVGVAKAKELLFTGDMIGAEEALRIGLVDKVVEPEKLKDEVTQVAKRISGNGPIAVGECKKLVQFGQSMDLDAALMFEAKSFGALFASADQTEGMAAFLEKRAAKFQGK